jgi:hypothetical protein
MQNTELSHCGHAGFTRDSKNTKSTLSPKSRMHPEDAKCCGRKWNKQHNHMWFEIAPSPLLHRFKGHNCAAASLARFASPI